MRAKHLPNRRWRLGAAFLILCGLATASPGPVRADDGDGSGPKPAPRAAVTIGGISVVLIAANDRLYAFVDRIADNAPADDASITVASANAAAQLDMQAATAGLFVAPFVRTGHLRDVLTVGVRSADGSGQGTAALVYDDAPSPVAGRAGSGLEVFIALVAGALGAASALAVVWYRQSRRRPGDGTRKPRAV
jgi:hypothetical protein